MSFPEKSKTALKNTLDALLSSWHGPHEPGLSILVKADGQVLYEKSIGLAHVEKGLPLRQTSNFRLASVSKQFTAAGIQLLAQDKKLFLNDLLVEYFPTLPQAFSAINLLHLLNHTSGLPDYEDFVSAKQEMQVTDLQVLEIISQQSTLLFIPGSAFRYSNTGYVLLGLVIEKVSGLSFADFLKQEVFKPAGMVTSTVYQQGQEITNRAMGYAPSINQSFAYSDQSLTSATSGDGCLYSSVHDYTLWDQALTGQQLFDLESLLIDSASIIENNANWRYHYGWFFGKRQDGSSEMYHTGNSCGFSHLVLRIPAEGVLVAAFSNVADHQGIIPTLVQTLEQHQVFVLQSDLIWALPTLTR